jgi:hypothetical protein
MTVLRFLFPEDTVGVGDFAAACTLPAVALYWAHRARHRPRPLTPWTLNRINQHINERGGR